MHEIFHFPSEWSTLQMRVDFPQHKSSKFVLYFPWVSGNAISQKTDGLANAFANAGFHFVRFEYRCYREQGKFEQFSLEDDHVDIASALEFLDARFPNSRHWAIWKSFGWLRLLSFDLSNRFECMGFLAPAVFIWDEDTIESLSDENYGSITSVDDFRMISCDLEKVSSPIILIHGLNDQSVSVSNSEILISHFSNPNNRIVRIEGSGHSFDDENGNRILCTETAKFFSENF